MKINFIFCCFLFLTLPIKSQVNCEAAFMKDTMSLPEIGKILEGEYIETTLKDFSVVRLFKANDNKYYLRFIVKKNFYFNKVDVLEIRSGNKSYYAKESKQYKINKTTGLFIIEVFKNYISTLKDEGITSIYFAKAETDFTRQDASEIKKMSKCFYDAITHTK
jgi:hypothetical protein